MPILDDYLDLLTDPNLSFDLFRPLLISFDIFDPPLALSVIIFNNNDGLSTIKMQSQALIPKLARVRASACNPGTQEVQPLLPAQHPSNRLVKTLLTLQIHLQLRGPLHGSLHGHRGDRDRQSLLVEGNRL